jgi:hypothetical protein
MTSSKRVEPTIRGLEGIILDSHGKLSRVEVLRHIDSGTSYRKVAQIFGVGRTQIANIFKRKSEILEDYESDVPGNRKRRKGGTTRNYDVNKLCYAWYKEACASSSQNCVAFLVCITHLSL